MRRMQKVHDAVLLALCNRLGQAVLLPVNAVHG